VNSKNKKNVKKKKYQETVVKNMISKVKSSEQRFNDTFGPTSKKNILKALDKEKYHLVIDLILDDSIPEIGRAEVIRILGERKDENLFERIKDFASIESKFIKVASYRALYQYFVSNTSKYRELNEFFLDEITTCEDEEVKECLIKLYNFMDVG
jgi:hypothetical protein